MKPLSVSVIVPACNETGNIEEIIKRTPSLGVLAEPGRLPMLMEVISFIVQVLNIETWYSDPDRRDPDRRNSHSLEFSETPMRFVKHRVADGGFHAIGNFINHRSILNL